MDDVCIIGLGYIGLPTAIVTAKAGLKVSGFDINPDVVSTIKRQTIKLSEPGLLDELKNQLNSGNLKVSNALTAANIFVLCVPTPIKFEGKRGNPDLSFVYSAVKDIANFLKEGDLIIVESTCPVGTTDNIYKLLTTMRPDLVNIYVAYCPERILPGNALYELAKNSRIIGGASPKSAIMARDFYQKFVEGSIEISDAKTAEMCKIVENSFRDVNIAFANEISMVAHELDININELIYLANKHPRVSILKPGVGVGGHCLPIDPWFLIDKCITPTEIMKTARDVNKRKTEWTAIQIEKLIDNFENDEGRSPRVAMLGVTYKPDTEDIRESSSFEIISILNERRSNIFIVDPYIKILKQFETLTLKNALETCDIFVMLVAHKQFILDDELKLKGKNFHSFT